MRIPPHHAIIHLPVLAPHEAKLVIRVLGRVLDAVWRAHGPAIEFQVDARPESASTPEPAPQSSLDEIF
jgi:hypothetical protein